jgi:hypothetical protein
MRLPDNSITLAGSVRDDGLPMALPSIEWTQVAGPEPSAFADVTSPTSQATFFVAGTYTLRLTASDGEFATDDEVTVTVAAANAPPEVNAGSDLTIEWPAASVTLIGSASDDGVPDAMFALQWTQLSGPSPAVFDSAQAASTIVTFPSEGVYVLQLAAHDGELEASDDVAVTVSPEPPSPPAEDDSGGSDDVGGSDNVGAVSAPAVGDGGGGRFNLLELLLLGALFAYSRFATRMRSPPGPENP